MLCVDDAEKAPTKHNGERMKAMAIMKLGYFKARNTLTYLRYLCLLYCSNATAL